MRIDHICYGDRVCFDWQEEEKSACRMTVMLESLKLYSQEEMPTSNVNVRKMSFEVCSPSGAVEERKGVGSDSMVCLRSVSTGLYLRLSSTVFPAFQFAYQLTLAAEIDKLSIFRLVTSNTETTDLYTDYPMSIVSYYEPKVYLNV